MAHGILPKIFDKIMLSAAIALVNWSVVAAQQTSPSQESQASETEEIVFATPSLDQVKTLRSEAEAAANLSEPEKKICWLSWTRQTGFWMK